MSIPCRHWRACGVIGGGCCAANVRQRPSYGFCMMKCEKYAGPDRGSLRKTFLRGGSVIPSHHQPRHAQILVGGPPGPVLLGDRIASGLKKLGVRECAGCTKRKQIVNAADRAVRGVFAR